jgi:hypothetical protein
MPGLEPGEWMFVVLFTIALSIAVAVYVLS